MSVDGKKIAMDELERRHVIGGLNYSIVARVKSILDNLNFDHVSDLLKSGKLGQDDVIKAHNIKRLTNILVEVLMLNQEKTDEWVVLKWYSSKKVIIWVLCDPPVYPCK